MLTKQRSKGGYSLASHPQAELSTKEVNVLYDLARMYALGIAADTVQIQRFTYTIPALDTTNKTFTTTIDQCRVVGGYVEVENIDVDYDFDFGKTGDTDCFINDFDAGSIITAKKRLAIKPTYLQDGDDVILTIATNGNTGPVKVQITLLCDHVTEFAPTGTITLAKTLTSLDSGTVFMLGTNVGGIIVALPALQEGLKFKFIVENNTPVGAITISATAAVIFGNIHEAEVDTSNDGPGSAGATGVTSVIFGTAATTGDFVELICDGTNWYLSGMTELDGSLTTA